MRGRKPKPTLLKQLEGNPGKRPLNDREPVAPPGIPDPPAFLDEVAREEWTHTVKVLAGMRLLSLADRVALAAYCTAYSRWVHAEAQVKKLGPVVKSPDKGFPMMSPFLIIANQSMEQMRKLLVEFGLTPSSRSRLRVRVGFGVVDELAEFLEAG